MRKSLKNKLRQPNPPKTVYSLIEIPKGESNKYEYDPKLEALVLDRALYGAVFYPTEYGHILNTLSEDGDPLDIMVITSFPTFPGCLIKSQVVAALEVVDSGQKDTKIIAVAASDPGVNYIKDVKDLTAHFKAKVENFWQRYSELQPEKEIKVSRWHGKAYAQKVVSQAIKRWQKSVE